MSSVSCPYLGLFSLPFSGRSNMVGRSRSAKIVGPLRRSYLGLFIFVNKRNQNLAGPSLSGNSASFSALEYMSSVILWVLLPRSYYEHQRWLDFLELEQVYSDWPICISAVVSTRRISLSFTLFDVFLAVFRIRIRLDPQLIWAWLRNSDRIRNPDPDPGSRCLKIGWKIQNLLWLTLRTRTEKCSDWAEILTTFSSQFFKNLLIMAIFSYLALLKSNHIEWKFFADCVII